MHRWRTAQEADIANESGGAILISVSTVVVAFNAQLLHRLDRRSKAVSSLPHPV
ncbi:MAG: hypothetical protein IT338_12695 [Thermomicrobiales bacterium]|nr:hypothetical protein [Thermomicrobiales bacterium]